MNFSGTFNQLKLLVIVVLSISRSTHCQPSTYDALSLCEWNYIQNRCTPHADGMIFLLSNFTNEFGHMMRCEFARSKTLCEDLSPKSCAWDETSQTCRVGSVYLITAITDCLDEQNANTIKCKQSLLRAVFEHQWINESTHANLEYCNFKFQNRDRTTCKILKQSVECAMGDTSSNCMDHYPEYNQYKFAYQLQQDIQQLTQLGGDKQRNNDDPEDEGDVERVLETQFLENQLRLQYGYFAMFMNCKKLGYTKCESSSVLRVRKSGVQGQQQYSPQNQKLPLVQAQPSGFKFSQLPPSKYNTSTNFTSLAQLQDKFKSDFSSYGVLIGFFCGFLLTVIYYFLHIRGKGKNKLQRKNYKNQDLVK
eukprot:TRINITY_DN8929_c0_g3_i1.p2 TRINITY_DN8929_c0_g3~~TRINITY_DN8929_c0_g3_i1.p2  ORF type:complete len:424 (+),score=15.06 TRINITY_DN8929_c0_g3_i1:181-1272(+)